MQYKKVSLDIKSGDVILFRNNFRPTAPITWLAAGIRFFTKAKYNHVGVVVSSWGVLMFNESLGNGAISRPLEPYLVRSKSEIMILRMKEDVNERDFCTRANSKLGTKYDFASLFVHQLWYRLTGKWVGKSAEDSASKTMICSEYVAWCHKQPMWWLYTPKELINNPNFEIYWQE